MDVDYFQPGLLLAFADDGFTSGVYGDSEVIEESSVPALIENTLELDNFISVETTEELSSFVVQNVGIGFAFASFLVLATFGVFKAFSLLHIKY